MKALLDIPPLTLSLSPEYEGEGTRAGLWPDRVSRTRLYEMPVQAMQVDLTRYLVAQQQRPDRLIRFERDGRRVPQVHLHEG